MRGSLSEFSESIRGSQDDSDFLRNYSELAGNGLALYSIDGLPGGQLIYAPSTELSAFEQAVNPIITKPLWSNLLLPLIVVSIILLFRKNE